MVIAIGLTTHRSSNAIVTDTALLPYPDGPAR
jgi:hypothetical protein